MKKLLFGTIAVAGLSLVAAGAMAGPRGGGHWEKMDANGDGELTADEMSAHHAEMIEKADADGNGSVSREELRAYHKAKRAEWREKRNPDVNDDGVIDRTEFVNAAGERFDRLDKNGDGVLSEDERPRRRGHHRRNKGGDKDE